MRIALAQLNPIVGDIAGNERKIVAAIEQARKQSVELVAFSELVLLGYPPKDLLLKPQFIQENCEAIERIARAAVGLTALVGFAEPTRRESGRPLYNAVAVCRDGRVERTQHKSLLPTYDVFDEDRYFERGETSGVGFVCKSKQNEWRIGVSICEDIWNDAHPEYGRRYARDPLGELIGAGVNLVINASASPYVAGKDDYRRDLFSGQAHRAGVPLVYVNQVGGNDDLVFDGGSAVFAPGRGIIARAKAFEEDLLVVDLADGAAAARNEPYPNRLDSIHSALILGARDYVRKCGFEGVVIGLSGGVDSALTATIAVDALGRQAVHGVAMPSRFSSPDSLADARTLAENLGIDFRVLPIDKLHGDYEKTLAGLFEGRPPDETEENIQVRIRGALLMALSNKFGWLLLSTGNKSELAVGYCTLYGDMCGGLAVVSDVPKTTVYELARAVNRRASRAVIPQRTIERAPTAELRPNQTDQDTLPPYDVLDEILRRYVEEMQSADEIVAAGFDAAVVRDVTGKVDHNEYKRKQAAVGLKVTSRAFGTGRRMPIAARYRA